MEMQEITKRCLFIDDKKVEILNLEELKRTVNAIDMGRQTKTRPVSHFKFIEDILSILNESGHKTFIDHIYCAKSAGTKIIPKIEEQYGVAKILEAWILDRITGKIMISTLSNEEVQCCIAFSYHDKGLDLAFGTDVRDCTNMCIYGSNILHTYGSKKDVNYERIMQVLKEWSGRFDSMYLRDLEITQKMKEVTVTSGDMLKFIGKLTVLAVKANIPGMKVVAPLNITQVNEVVRGILAKKGDKFYEGPDCTLWEFYNFMTFCKKGDTSDITTLLIDIADLGNMVITEFNVLSDSNEL